MNCMKLVNKSLLVGIFSVVCVSIHAQEKPLPPNQNSVRPIDESSVHYKARLWRRMDLNEKIDQPFFSHVGISSWNASLVWIEAFSITTTVGPCMASQN